MVFLILTAMLFQSGPTVIVESSQELFTRAVSMTLRADGSIAVCDQAKNSVSIVNSNNEIEHTIGGAGWGSEAFGLPTDVSSSFLLDLYVTDNANKRVQRFDKQLRFIQEFDERTVTGIDNVQPIASALSANGDLYILDEDGKRVVQLNGRFQVNKIFGGYSESENSIRHPNDIAASSDNEILILDGERILLFDRFGNFIRTYPLTAGRTWTSLSVNGRMVVAVANDRITIIHLDTSLTEEIIPESVIGRADSSPFVDAQLLENHLILLTATTVYRCSITMP